MYTFICIFLTYIYTYIFFLDGSVSIAETGKNNDYPEGNI